MHIAEADWDNAPPMALDFRQALRKAYPGVIIYAGKYDGERARRTRRTACSAVARPG